MHRLNQRRRAIFPAHNKLAPVDQMITTLPISIEVDVAQLMHSIIAIRGLLRYDGLRVEIEYLKSSD